MAKTKDSKVVSKKHLARLERERRQTRAITYTAVGLIVIVVGLIAYGILNQTVFMARQPIVELGNEATTTREFQLRVRVRRHQLISQYFQYYQIAQMFGIDLTTDTTGFADQLAGIEDELNNPVTLGQNVVDDITENMLIRRYAAEQGITITDEDIEAAVKAGFDYYPDGTPTPTITPTTLAYSTLNATQLALVPPTDTAMQEGTATLKPTETREPTATLDPLASPLPTETPLPTDTPTPAPTATTAPTHTEVPTQTQVPTATSTATPYTLDGFEGAFENVYSAYKEYGMTEADFRRIFFEENLYYDAVFEAVTADVPHEQEMVWARHILVADKAEADIVRDELLAGSRFDVLTAIHSLDTSNNITGGDLGWFSAGTMVTEFEGAAFTLPIGAISDPIQTSYGWHIIQVLGHENRPLTEKEYEAACETAYQEWLSVYKDAASDLVIHSDWVARVPTDPTIEGIYANMQTQQAETLAAMPTDTPVP